jgi:hypothetical protein
LANHCGPDAAEKKAATTEAATAHKKDHEQDTPNAPSAQGARPVRRLDRVLLCIRSALTAIREGADQCAEAHDLSATLRRRLGPTERRFLAVAAVTALDRRQAEELADVLARELRPAGEPLPALLDEDDDAAAWAALASREELRAYMAAAWRALSPGDQEAFRRLTQAREAA